MNKKIEETTRQQISAFLPDAIAQTLKSYHCFAQQEVRSKDSKEFSEYHKACKVAIAHIELLIKLAKWADLPDAGAGDHNHQIILSAILQEAQNEVEAHEKSEGSDTEERFKTGQEEPDSCRTYE